MPAPKKANGKPSYNYTAITENQRRYLETIDEKKITLALGPAGAGKSFLAVAKALDYLYMKNHSGGVKQIILTRPAVECAGEKLGSLPGDISEKISPYMFPLYDNLRQLLDKGTVEKLISDDKVHVLPLAYSRGITYRSSFVVVDEAQNTLPSQMKCVLTRMDEKTKVVICGDLEQSDIKNKNGMEDAIERLSHIEEIGIVELTEEDIQRSKIIKEIIKAYRK